MKPLFTIFCLFLSLSVFTQDTIKVQTLTWDSDFRAANFQFPEDPNQTYRKIWMRYNMRCHDNAVGNGNVGCREWDYSCNTFITDPNRTDSTRQNHPSYVISNFSDDVFDYVESPTYTYTEFNQHHTTISGTTTEHTVGNGTDNYALYSGQEVAKMQFLYTQAELMGAGLSAGNIAALRMDITDFGAAIDYFRIKLKATNQAELSAADIDESGFTEVYFSNTNFDASGWKDFNFYQDFTWDGNSNLLMEVSFTSENVAGNAGINGEETDFTSSLFSGETDGSLLFAGSGGVSVPAEDLSNISNEITISLWTFGTAATLPVNTYAFEGMDDNNQRQVNVHLPWSNGQIYWDCGNDGTGYDRINRPALEAEYEGQWNHWAFTKNATTGIMNIYLNGELWHSGNNKFRPIDIQRMVLGANQNFTSHYYGHIDEFQIWDKALEGNTIKEWMYKKTDDSHPFYQNLLTYYRMNEGGGFILNDESTNDNNGQIAVPNWQSLRGKDLFKNITESSKRPNIQLLQGDVTIEDMLITVMDSVQNPVNQVVEYEVQGTDLVAIDTQYLYQAGSMWIFNEAGIFLNTIEVEPTGSLTIEELTYYQKQDAKYEILSLVTPYGNGLGLGAAGKTFIFDVTDYAPILKGEKRLSIEMGGEFQEELDIQFIYVTGTPEKEVLDIQNIWPFRRGWFQDIMNDRYFEPRDVTLHTEGTDFKLRSAITGHGQNGEFVSREHFLNVNGGSKEFEYDVWKYCGKNPIYPQGGTWIFDRAGWCPGEATDVHEFSITDLANPGETIQIDYGVNGNFMAEANYLVSNQLVTYGDYAFSVDASIESIIRPNNWQVQYERLNPACNHPTILVRNSGANTINSIEVAYNVKGGEQLVYTWQGSLAASETTEIILPLESTSFWQADEQVFEVNLLNVNGSPDEYADNNYAANAYEQAKVFDFEDPIALQINTNVQINDNSYSITDAQGNIVMQRQNMASATLYEDEINLPAGCYTFNFEDASNDGLQFWFFPENGSGFVRFSRYFNGLVWLPIQSFISDMGGGVQFDFEMSPVVSTEDIEHYQLFSVFPNPSSGQLNVELHGFEHQEFNMQLVDITGKTLLSKQITVQSNTEHIEQLDLSAFAKGMYYLKVGNAEKVWVREVVLVD